MASDNRNNRREDNTERRDDNGTFDLPFSGEYGMEAGFMATGRPYEGVAGQFAGANDTSRRGQHYGRGPAGYKRSDARIDEDVNDHLTQHSYIDATNITVTVKDGEVTLEGSVPDRDQKRYAEDVAAEVPGVTDVTNMLKIAKPQSDLTQNPSGKQ